MRVREKDPRGFVKRTGRLSERLHWGLCLGPDHSGVFHTADGRREEARAETLLGPKGELAG